MSNPKKIFLIGDTHFGHSKIIQYCSRPFASAEEMDATLIERWNSTVGKEDLVYHLGDFSLQSKDTLVATGLKLNGIKTLIRGNHDSRSADTYYAAGFKYFSPHPIIINEYFILSHEPRFTSPNSPLASIYAHVHNNPMYKDYTEGSFCVSAERINYRPISLYEIMHKMDPNTDEENS